MAFCQILIKALKTPLMLKRAVKLVANLAAPNAAVSNQERTYPSSLLIRSMVSTCTALYQRLFGKTDATTSSSSEVDSINTTGSLEYNNLRETALVLYTGARTQECTPTLYDVLNIKLATNSLDIFFQEAVLLKRENKVVEVDFSLESGDTTLSGYLGWLTSINSQVSQVEECVLRETYGSVKDRILAIQKRQETAAKDENWRKHACYIEVVLFFNRSDLKLDLLV